MKKILVLKVRYEVDNFNDRQIELLKSMLLAGMEESCRHQASFEVLIEDEYASAERLLQQVRSEFKEQDE